MSLPAWARVGAKVVCISADVHPEWMVPHGNYNMPGMQGLTRGATYTIRAVANDGIHPDGLYLEEIIRPTNGLGRECVFDVRRFRPVKTIEDDISTHFKALLDVRAPQFEDAT